MVDLHVTQPAMAEGHPWLRFSRWSLTWRVWLAGASVTALVVLLLTVVSLAQRTSVSLIEVPLGWGSVLFVPALVFAAITALLGRWLRRFNSFTQSLIFALVSVVSIWLLVFIIDVVVVLQRECPPNTYCSQPGEAAIWVTYLYLGPTFLIAVVSYGLAIWSSRGRMRQRVLGVWAGVILVVFLALSIAAATGNSTTAPPQGSSAVGHEGERLPEGMCPDFDATGNPVTVPCRPE